MLYGVFVRNIDLVIYFFYGNRHLIFNGTQGCGKYKRTFETIILTTLGYIVYLIRIHVMPFFFLEIYIINIVDNILIQVDETNTVVPKTSSRRQTKSQHKHSSCTRPEDSLE